MQTDLPLISVIVPAYNAEAFISRTLQSILAQTYQKLEILVVDDGSQDRTAEIVESFIQKDNRIVLLQQANAGVAAARNLAIEKSRGEYIAPIDADDIWYPQKLEKQVQSLLTADLSVGLIYCWSVTIDEEDAILGKYNLHYFLNFHTVHGNVYPAMLFLNFIGNASVPLIRRTCFEKLGGYDCTLREQHAQGCEDLDIYLRIAENYQFQVVPEFLVGYRQVTGSMSRAYKAMEKSYSLVMENARKRYPNFYEHIYKWSACHFYIYLMYRSKACGDAWNTLVYIYKAVKLDYSPLLKSSLYRYILLCSMQILFGLIISFISMNKQSTFALTKELNSESKNARRNHAISHLEELLYNNQKLPMSLYERIRWHRCSQVLQICQTVSYKEYEDKYKREIIAPSPSVFKVKK
jgi:glycosyltransferase involved in cell wall biosynthesis